MRIRRYIQGHRKGREANRIEREAMHDPFLADALEGFDRMKNDPTPHIDILRRKIRSRNQRRLDFFKYGGIAASLIFILGFGLYFGFHKNNLQEEITSYSQAIEYDAITETADSFENHIAQNRQEAQKEIEKPTSPAPAAQALQAPVMSDADAHSEVMKINESEIAEDLIAVEEVVQLQEEEEKLSTIEEKEEVVVQSRMSARAKESSVVEKRQQVMSSEPVIGFDAYHKYLNEKMVRPTDNCKDMKGKVILNFKVNASGKPYDIKIEQSVCASIDKEAIRLLEEGPLWKPSDIKVFYPIDFQ